MKAQFLTNEQEIKSWLKKMNIQNYTINSDLTVDVKADVNICYKNLEYIPIQFGKVAGDFNCSHNKLVSLEGSPFEVGPFEFEKKPYNQGNFDCSYNQLENLDFTPKKIFKDMICNSNIKLNTLPSYGCDMRGFIFGEEDVELVKIVKELRPYLAKDKNDFYNLKMHLIQEYLEKEYLKNQLNNSTDNTKKNLKI